MNIKYSYRIKTLKEFLFIGKKYNSPWITREKWKSIRGQIKYIDVWNDGDLTWSKHKSYNLIKPVPTFNHYLNEAEKL